MTKKILWKETAAVASVALVIAGLPLLLWYWQAVISLRNYPLGTKVINLTAIAKDGIWTQDEVVGWNYWWRTPKRTEDIPLQLGDNVLLRLRSVDVLHSFAIPLLHVGPVEVPSGHTVELQFRADRPGNLTFLCWQVCSPEHQNLRGRFMVTGEAR